MKDKDRSVIFEAILLYFIVGAAMLLFGQDIGFGDRELNGVKYKPAKLDIVEAPRSGLVREYLSFRWITVKNNGTNRVCRWKDSSASQADAIQDTALYQPVADSSGTVRFLDGAALTTGITLSTCTVVVTFRNPNRTIQTAYAPFVFGGPPFVGCGGAGLPYGNTGAFYWLGALVNGWQTPYASITANGRGDGNHRQVIGSVWGPEILVGVFKFAPYFNGSTTTWKQSFVLGDYTSPVTMLASSVWNGSWWEYPTTPAPDVLTIGNRYTTSVYTGSPYCYDPGIVNFRVYNRWLDDIELVDVRKWRR